MRIHIRIVYFTLQIGIFFGLLIQLRMGIFEISGHRIRIKVLYPDFGLRILNPDCDFIQVLDLVVLFEMQNEL